MSDNIPGNTSLSKLQIHCFTDKNFKQEDKSKLFTAPINPESFSKNYTVDLDTRRGIGQPGTLPGYKSSVPESLKLDFVLDGTGTMEGYVEEYKYLPVNKQLAKFLQCAYDYNGDTHRPNYLIIHWGSEIKFPCVLSSVDIDHTLFSPNGDPLRVKISANFTAADSDEARAAAKKINSPDLTHYRKVQQGDRLDLMTYRIYNDSKYFLQVARINGLTTVRSLQTGSEIYFPPFDKNAS